MFAAIIVSQVKIELLYGKPDFLVPHIWAIILAVSHLFYNQHHTGILMH